MINCCWLNIFIPDQNKLQITLIFEWNLRFRLMVGKEGGREVDRKSHAPHIKMQVSAAVDKQPLHTDLGNLRHAQVQRAAYLH
jgi:hypothetical protein